MLNLEDKSSNCHIFDGYLHEDLISYNIVGSTIEWSNGSSSPITFKLDAVSSLFNEQPYGDIEDNVWYPVFIDHDNYVPQASLSSHGILTNQNGYLRSGKLGIESMVEFKPQFSNWNTNAKMHIDWLMNQATFPFPLYYSLMFWVRKPTQPTITGLIEDLPFNSVLEDASGEKYFKTNNQILTRLSDKELVPVSDVSGLKLHYPFLDATNGMSMWIPDGDIMAFNNASQLNAIHLNNNICARAYTSTSLHRFVREINHILTLKEVKSINRSLKRSRFIKMISACLSTSPFVDQTCIESMYDNEVYRIINEYIESDFTNMQQQLNVVRNAVLEISKYLTLTKKLSYKTNTNTLTNNFIESKNTLFIKLMNKYGGYLYCDNNSISYKRNLPYNASVDLTQHKIACVNKNVEDTILFANESISCGELKVSTFLDNTQTSIGFDGTEKMEIPLYDIEKKRVIKLETIINIGRETNVGKKYMANDIDDRTSSLVESFQDDQAYLYRTQGPSNIRESVMAFAYIPLSVLYVTTDGGLNPTNEPMYDGNVAGYVFGTSFDWKISEGNASFGASSRATTSTSASPDLYVYSPTRVRLRCKITTPYGSSIRYKTIYVVSGVQRASFDEVEKRLSNPLLTGEEIEGTTFLYSNPGVPLHQDDLRILGLWLDSTDNTWKPPEQNVGETFRDKIDTRNVIACISGLDRVVLHHHGVFWPIGTSFRVRKDDGSFLSTAPGGENFNIDESQKLDQKFKFINKTAPNFSASPLSIQYITELTKYKLYSITLKNIRNGHEDCSQCLSVCNPQIEGYPATSFVDGFRQTTTELQSTDNSNAGFRLVKYEGEVASRLNRIVGTIEYDSAKATTEFVALKSYGGYSNNVLNKINVNIPNHPLLPDNSKHIHSNPSYLPKLVDEFPMQEYIDSDAPVGIDDKKVCIPLPHSHGTPITFNKGVFNPAEGWIPATGNNDPNPKTAVLKFRPSVRKSHSFTGPGLTDLDCQYTSDLLNLKPAYYKSSISIKIYPEIAPGPFRKPSSATVDPKTPFKKVIHDQKELIEAMMIDQDVTYGFGHGYRILAGGKHKSSIMSSKHAENDYIVSDEFYIKIDKPNMINYNFVRISPGQNPSTFLAPLYTASFEEWQEAENSENPMQDILTDTITEGSINDLEIKINFLDYVHFKDLQLWCSLQPDAVTKKSLQPIDTQPPKSPIIGSARYLDQPSSASSAYGTNLRISNTSRFLTEVSGINNDLGSYVSNLLATSEVNDSEYDMYSVMLMNQEHLRNNSHYTDILFSDTASRSNVPFDHNLLRTDTIDIYQNIINENKSLQPSMVANGYTDEECVKFKHLLTGNRITLTNNQFGRFNNYSLFQREDEFGNYMENFVDSNTTIHLNIAVLDEPEIMYPYDTTIDGQYLSGFSRTEVSATSPYFANSLCNWEAILHTSSDAKTFPPKTSSTFSATNNTDALALIDYGYEPKYNGYNFIADLSQHKFLLPTVNINAPNPTTDDLTLCSDSKSEYSTSRTNALSPAFPTAKILLAMANVVGPTAYAGNLVGALAGMNGVDTSMIIDYLNDTRKANNKADDKTKQYGIDYSEYPMGSPEKILISANNGGGFWYRLEASIFKYANTPALKLNEYSFKLLEKDTFPMFSNLIAETVNSLDDFFDDNFIKSIKLDCSDLNSIGSTQDINQAYSSVGVGEVNSIQLNENDIILVNINSDTMQRISELGENVLDDCSIFEGWYIVKESSWEMLYPKSSAKYEDLNPKPEPLKVNDSSQYISANKVIVELESIFNNFHQRLLDNKYIKIESELAFYMFDTGDKIDTFVDGSENFEENTIESKSLITKNGKFYTIFALSQASNDMNRISPSKSNSNTKILLFKNQSTIDNKKNKPLSKWSLEKSNVEPDTIDRTFSTTGLGSYGNGSINRDKIELTEQLHHNKISPIYEQIDTRKFTKLESRNITLTSPSGETLNYTTQINGYSVSSNEIRDLFHNNIVNINQDQTINDLLQDKMLYGINAIDEDAAFMIMSIPSLKSQSRTAHSASEVGVDHGTIKISGDLDNNNGISIDEDTMALLTNRLNILEAANTDDTLPIGEKTETPRIINTSNIAALTEHYNILDNDKGECYTPDGGDDCYKKDTFEILQTLYQERANILHFISVANKTNGIMHQKLEVTVGDKGILSFNLKDISQDLYWINIDGNQACTVDYNMSPKILTEIDYTCNSQAYGKLGIAQTFANNLCPDYLFQSTRQYNFTGNASLGIPNVEVGGGGSFAIYSFDEAYIDAKKEEAEAQYPDITGWKTRQRLRYMLIPGDNKGQKISKFTIVTVKETYEVALPLEETDPKNPSLNKDNSLDTNPFSAKRDDGDPETSNDRIGYPDFYGRKSNRPTSVYNIFNLNDSDSIQVMFRKAVRQTRGHDMSGKVMKYTQNGSIYQPETGVGGPQDLDIFSGNGTLFTDMDMWHCYKAVVKGGTGYIEEQEPTPFCKMMNEMEFRAFYGSTDNIQNKDIVLDSKFQHQLIPYEFFNKTDFKGVY
jgi:hypothetical protein